MALKYEELNHVQWNGLPRGKTIVVIPCSPLEEHSVHLPLGVDSMIARYFSEEMASRLEKKAEEWQCVLLPTLHIGSDTLKYAGSLETSQRLVHDVIYGLAKKIAQDGFRYILLVNGHGGPRHLVALEEVSEKISWLFPSVRMASVTGPSLLKVVQGQLTDKLVQRSKEKGLDLSADAISALKTDYHAGMIETSLMMAIRPDLVTDRYKDLKPAIVSKPWKITKNSGKKAGEGLGHLGSPQYSSKVFGEAIIEVLLEEVMPKIEHFLTAKKKSSKEFRSFLYYIPVFRTHFKTMVLVAMSFIAFFMSMTYFTRLLAQMAIK